MRPRAEGAEKATVDCNFSQAQKWKINFRQIPLIFHSAIATFRALLNADDGVAISGMKKGEAKR